MISVNHTLRLKRVKFYFRKYRMALNWDKYEIEVIYSVAIKCNLILFDFVQKMFSSLDGFYIDKDVL